MPRSELVQSLLRGMDILQLVARAEAGLTLRELCEQLDLKRPTAHNLIRTLAARRFLDKSERPIRYRLGPALYDLATEHYRHAVGRRAAETILRLFRQLRASMDAPVRPDEDAAITFSRHVGDEIVMALRLRLAGPPMLERPRINFDPYSSAAALVFQAYWSQAERQDYWRKHPFRVLGAETWKSQERLSVFLDQVERDGFCVAEFYGPEVLRVAAPVFDQGQVMVGAIGLGIWRRLGQRERVAYTNRVTEAARELSASL